MSSHAEVEADIAGRESARVPTRRYPARAAWVRPAAARLREDVTRLLARTPPGAAAPVAVLDRFGDDLEQAVAEVLANAVAHGSRPGDDMEVAVALVDDRIRVRVVDAARGAATSPARVVGPREPSADAERGRGLHLVERLVDEVRREGNPNGGLVTELWVRPRRREA